MQKDQNFKEPEFSNQGRSKKEPKHLKQAPSPKGRDGQQIDPDTEI